MIDLTEHLSQRKPKGEHSELLPEADRVTPQEKRPRLVWWGDSGVSGKLFKRVTDAKAGEAMVIAVTGNQRGVMVEALLCDQHVSASVFSQLGQIDGKTDFAFEAAQCRIGSRRRN